MKINYDCSKRLNFSKLQESDIKHWIEFVESPIAIKYLNLDLKAHPQQRAKHWIEKQKKRYELNGFGLQKLTTKENGIFVGMCGLLDQEIEGNKEIEVGYHLFQKHWGKGFASEASEHCIDLAFKQLNIKSIISIIHPKNINSVNVALKNKMKFEKEIIFYGLKANIYRVNESEWNTNVQRVSQVLE